MNLLFLDTVSNFLINIQRNKGTFNYAFYYSMRECLKYKKLKAGHCQDDQQLDFFVMNIHGNASRKEIELS